MAPRVLTGALAGLIATVPMTCVMARWHRFLPWSQQDSLPPAHITKKVLGVPFASQRVSSDETLAATLAAHFGFGTTAGIPFACLLRTRNPSQAAAAGMAYGVGVWSTSYLQALPRMGLYRSPQHEPAARHALMLGAHIVWGLALGVVTQALLAEQRDETTDG